MPNMTDRELVERVRASKLDPKREAVRKAMKEYLAALRRERDNVPRGSGHAENDFDHLNTSITQTLSAARVMWFEDIG